MDEATKRKVFELRELKEPFGGVGRSDSVEKMMHILARVSPEPVVYKRPAKYWPYKNKEQVRKNMSEIPINFVGIGPSLFRKFVCTVGCNACCVKITIDYLPVEWPEVMKIRPDVADKFKEDQVEVNGQWYPIMTSDQRLTTICDFMDGLRPGPEGTESLGCGLYRYQALSCWSAPQIQFNDKGKETLITKRPFGRAWQMHPSPECQFLPLETLETLKDDIRVLERFILWADYFKIPTVLPDVISAIERVISGADRLPVATIPIWRREE